MSTVICFENGSRRFFAQIAPIFRANFNFALKVQIFVTFELFVPQKWLTYQIKGLISVISEMP